jgi:hypothetical protein
VQQALYVLPKQLLSAHYKVAYALVAVYSNAIISEKAISSYKVGKELVYAMKT